MHPALYFITGPTATGKTALALRWASEHGADILNADSLLFYHGMDIGTAKPTAAERAQVPHHLIDICPPSETMSIKRYAAMARRLVQEQVRERGRPLLVVGGSGFYLKSFFAPVVDTVEASAAVRAQVDALEKQGLAALIAALRAASPAGTGTVDLLNPRRVARALERCLCTGRSLPELEAKFAALPAPFPDIEKRVCLLLSPDCTLHPRIAQRTQAMLSQGLLGEVRALLAAGLEHNPPAASSVGYREAIAWLGQHGAAELLPPEHPLVAELAAAINLGTRRLVAKQRKWFRTQLAADCVLERTAPGQDEQLYQTLCRCFARADGGT